MANTRKVATEMANAVAGFLEYVDSDWGDRGVVGDLEEQAERAIRMFNELRELLGV